MYLLQKVTKVWIGLFTKVNKAVLAMHDKFAIAQIGGYNASGIYEQYTYKTQVASAIAQGKRAYLYLV